MAQRLPIPGSDNGTWGSILNGFLEVSHNSDGTLLPSAVTAAGAASLASPAFTGTPTAPTAAANTSTTQLATTAFTTTAIGALSGQYAPVTPVESYSYIPGIVADGGITDNYAVISNYLSTLTNSGQNNLVLPPGLIGISTQLVVPTGVVLRGSGASNSIGGNYIYGTTLCPMKTGMPPTSIVALNNNLSGIQDINLLAKNEATGNICSYSLIVNAALNTARNVGLYYGSVATVSSTSSSVAFIASDLYMRGTVLCFDIVGSSDWQITNIDCSGAGNVLGGGQMTWTNCHFSMGPGGTTTSALITDGGANTFIGCYFDTVTSSAVPAMIDRTNAGSSTLFVGCQYIQNSTNVVTGIPLVKEATGTSFGAKFLGGRVENYFGTSGTEFTYFIQGVVGNTSVIGVECAAALSVGFSDASTGAGHFLGNVLVAQVLMDTIPGGATIYGNNGGSLAIFAQTAFHGGLFLSSILKTSNYTLSLTDIWIRGTGTWTFTLSVSSNTNRWIFVTNEGTGTITLTPASGTIDGLSSRPLAADTSGVFLCDGTNWHTAGDWGIASSNAAATTVNGTAGTLSCSQPFIGVNYKKVLIIVSSTFTSTGGVTYTFPVAFTAAPVVTTAAPGVTVTTTTTGVTLTAASAPGSITAVCLEGA